MDVHKNTYSLCGINSSTGEIIAQTKCAAEVKNILKFIKSAKERISEENEVDILTGYEAGCLGFSLYHELTYYDLLKKENKELKDRIRYLENLLDINHINYKQEDKPKTKENIKNETITKQHVIEFFRVFKGRQDVYSKRSVSKDGRVGYYPQCYNYWQEGLCPKKDGKRLTVKNVSIRVINN